MSVPMTITNAGLNLWRDGASGANNPTIKFLAVGTSSNGPQASDTQLGAEVFRKAISTFTNGLNPGELLITCYLGPADAANVNIQEVGIIGGSTATSAPNTGVLIAHGLYAHNKAANESFPLTLDLVF